VVVMETWKETGSKRNRCGNEKCSSASYGGEVRHYTLWHCLTNECTFTGCSRAADKHALEHATMVPGHDMAFCRNTRQVWCYSCDTYVHDVNLENLFCKMGLQ